MPGISVVTADSLEDLAASSASTQNGSAATVAEYNASIDPSIPFDPTVKDGRAARVEPPKSNWAAPIETRAVLRLPGHLRHHLHLRRAAGRHRRPGARESGEPIPGLFVCGEMLGGLFSGNYPGGSGLAAGMVFGRRAGSLA